MVDQINSDDKMRQSAELSDKITLTDYPDAVAKSYPQQLLKLAGILIKEEH